MIQRRAPVLLGLAGAAALAVASCGRGGAVWTDEGGLLKYVPADTPYLFAALEPQPEELVDKIQPWVESILESYREFFSAAYAQYIGGSSSLSQEEGQRAQAVADALTELLTADGRRDAGLDHGSLGILYGRGLLPVLRVSLTDGPRFEAWIERVETAATSSLPVATLGEHSYRYFENDAGRVVIAVDGDDLIVTIVPAGLSDAHLTAVLEGELPGESIARSAKLEDLAAEYGLAPYQTGFIDFDRLAATFLEPRGTDAELAALSGFDADAILSEVCRTEIRELANVAPRVVLGTTELSAEQMSVKFVLELRSDIAAGLAPIAASVPGLGTMSEALFAFGIGFDVAAARDFVSARLDALEADPFRCAQLQGIQAGMPEVRQALSSPLPPMVYGIKGFVAILDDIQGMNLAAGQPPTNVDFRMLLASDDAPGIVAMGSAFLPEIAALDLEPNGTPVRVDVPPEVGPMVSEAYAALTQQALAIAVGADSEARLRALISAPAGEPLLMAGDYDLRRYYTILSDAMSLSVARDPTMAPEMQEAMDDLLASLTEGPFDRARGEVRFTENGVEALSTVTLRE